MSKRTWGIGVVKFIKSESNQVIALAVGRKCGNTEWEILSRSCTPTAGCAGTDRMVYRYPSSYMFGSQLFDN
jgi:hypothetical protein